MGESLQLELQLNGQGLTRPLDWLKIYTSEHNELPFELVSLIPQQAVFLAEKNRVRLRLVAFNINW